MHLRAVAGRVSLRYEIDDNGPHDIRVSSDRFGLSRFLTTKMGYV
jgi:hypothetical protein